MKEFITPIFRAKDFESVEQLQELSDFTKRIRIQAKLFNEFADEILNKPFFKQ